MNTPEPTNSDRVFRVHMILDIYQALTHTDEEDILGDLLTDMMHWAYLDGYDFDLALSRAQGHYQEEHTP